MTLQNKIKADIAHTTTTTFSFILFIGFLYGYADVTTKYEQFLDIVTFCLFPFSFLYAFFNLHDSYILFISLGLNILLYSYFFIKLFSKKLTNTKGYRPYNLIHITVYVIPAIILIRIVYLMITSK